VAPQVRQVVVCDTSSAQGGGVQVTRKVVVCLFRNGGGVQVPRRAAVFFVFVHRGGRSVQVPRRRGMGFGSARCAAEEEGVGVPHGRTGARRCSCTARAGKEEHVLLREVSSAVGCMCCAEWRRAGCFVFGSAMARGGGQDRVVFCFSVTKSVGDAATTSARSTLQGDPGGEPCFSSLRVWM
jgi:hypothetical protein